MDFLHVEAHIPSDLEAAPVEFRKYGAQAPKLSLHDETERFLTNNTLASSPLLTVPGQQLKFRPKLILTQPP